MKIGYWLIKIVLTILMATGWAFLAMELMAVLLIMIVGSGLDEWLWRLFTVTPGVGNVRVIENVQVLKFLGFWGVFLAPVKLGLEKIGKIKFGVKFKEGAIGLTLGHVLAAIVGIIKMGWGVMPVLIALYGLTMVYWWFYSVIVRMDEAVEKYLG